MHIHILDVHFHIVSIFCAYPSDTEYSILNLGRLPPHGPKELSKQQLLYAPAADVHFIIAIRQGNKMRHRSFKQVIAQTSRRDKTFKKNTQCYTNCFHWSQ